MHFLNLLFAPRDLLFFLNCLLFSVSIYAARRCYWFSTFGKHAGTLGFKSVTENVEVFLRKACVIFQLGCAVAASSWEEGQFHSFTSILLNFVALERSRKGGWGIISQTRKTIYRPGKSESGHVGGSQQWSWWSELKTWVLLEKGQKYVSVLLEKGRVEH